MKNLELLVVDVKELLNEFIKENENNKKLKEILNYILEKMNNESNVFDAWNAYTCCYATTYTNLIKMKSTLAKECEVTFDKLHDMVESLIDKYMRY